MENTQITKKDDNTIEVVKTMPVSFTFTPEYLKSQKEAILKQKADFIAKRDLEIAEIDGYLAEMKKLNVTEKVVEEKEVVNEIADEVKETPKEIPEV